MTVLFKGGVTSNRLQPVMMLALSRLDLIFNSFGETLTITSTDDGLHSQGSLHYFGLAIDIRITDISSEKIPAIVEQINIILKQMDTRYQIMLEDNHIHIEHDRRVKK